MAYMRLHRTYTHLRRPESAATPPRAGPIRRREVIRVRAEVLPLALSGFTLIAACGGSEGPPAASEPAAPEPAEAQCTLLGNGCARELTYEMCCVGAACTFAFTDGTTFGTLDDALDYCRAGDVPAGVEVLSPSEHLGEEGGGTVSESEPPAGGGSGGGGSGQAANGGQGGGSSQNQSGGGGACYGTTEACQARYGPADCRENPGCYFRAGGCFGVSWACQSFYSPSQCGYQLGCRWDHYYEQCTGAAASCGSRSSSGACHTLRGCYWEDDECAGSAFQCSRHATESACRGQPGCYWR